MKNKTSRKINKYLPKKISEMADIDQIKNQLDILKNETFSPASTGTRYKVFVSEKYVIRFRDDDHDLLEREAK